MCIGDSQVLGITHTTNFKTMTTFNGTQWNSELLDEELSLTSLNGIVGGLDVLSPRPGRHLQRSQ